MTAFVVAALLVAIACVAASARRLWLVANAMFLDPDDVLAMLRKEADGAIVRRLADLVAEEPRAEWERDLFEALAASKAEVRAALVNEQLTELDRRLQEWASVPRTCARLALTCGIMLGMLVLRHGLAEAPEDLSGDLGELFVRQVVGSAIAVVGFGVVGMVFSILAHARARRMTKARLVAADRMIEKLEALAAGAAPASRDN